VNRMLQRTLLGLHGVVRRSGLLSTGPGRRLFEIGYDFYKARLEAGEIAGLRRYVRPGTCVVDVGANIGFFTVRFARWVSDGGRVLAVEPEADNHRSLERRLARAGLAGHVEVVRAAAGEREGWDYLTVNPHHPGDHRLSVADGDGEPVRLATIDGLLAARGRPAVSLIKIDVQGAEPRVIAGAAETLARFAPAIWMEVDPKATRRAGGDPRRLLEQMAAAGYQPHVLSRAGVGPALSVQAAAGLAEARGYADFLFLPRNH
jgi:FkbM family methyltransferase